MKWTRRKLYGLNALAVLCLLFPAPDSRASEGALRADSHEIIEQNTDRVTGRIMAADGEPLAGASVMIRGTKIGTTADADGNFSIKAPEEGGLMCLCSNTLACGPRRLPSARRENWT